MPQKPPSFLVLFLAIALVITLVGVLLILTFATIPKDNMELFTAIASGVVGSGVSGILGYVFGSSEGSKAKDDALSAIVTKGGQ